MTAARARELRTGREARRDVSQRARSRRAGGFQGERSRGAAARALGGRGVEAVAPAESRCWRTGQDQRLRHGWRGALAGSAARRGDMAEGWVRGRMRSRLGANGKKAFFSTLKTFVFNL